MALRRAPQPVGSVVELRGPRGGKVHVAAPDGLELYVPAPAGTVELWLAMPGVWRCEWPDGTTDTLQAVDPDGDQADVGEAAPAGPPARREPKLRHGG